MVPPDTDLAFKQWFSSLENPKPAKNVNVSSRAFYHMPPHRVHVGRIVVSNNWLRWLSLKESDKHDDDGAHEEGGTAKMHQLHKSIN